MILNEIVRFMYVIYRSYRKTEDIICAIDLTIRVLELLKLMLCRLHSKVDEYIPTSIPLGEKEFMVCFNEPFPEAVPIQSMPTAPKQTEQIEQSF